MQVAFDADYLYLAIRCYDREPGAIIARDLQQDSNFSSDDTVAAALDTFNRRREGYFFAVNPLGVRTDGLIQNNDAVHREWDAIWQAAARLTPEGWATELAIPFKSLVFDPAAAAWGLNRHARRSARAGRKHARRRRFQLPR